MMGSRITIRARISFKIMRSVQFKARVVSSNNSSTENRRGMIFISSA